MGWLFGKKKKIPKVPLPMGRPMDSETLQFPSRISSEKEIKLDQIKEAVGIKKEMELPSMMEEETNAVPEQSNIPSPFQQDIETTNFESPVNGPIYVKLNVYQRLLGEVEDLKSDLRELSNVNSQLETSEYNEEKNFAKLRTSVRTIHDRILNMDKTIFNAQGE